MANRKNKNKKKQQRKQSPTDSLPSQTPSTTQPNVVIEKSSDLDLLTINQLITLRETLPDWRLHIDQLFHRIEAIELIGSEKEFRVNEKKFNNEEEWCHHCNSGQLIIADRHVKNEAKAKEFCETITALMPNVEALLIFFHPRLNLLLPSMFNHYSANGKLKLFTMDGGSKDPQFNTKLWASFRSLRSLRSIMWYRMPAIPPAIQAQSGMWSHVSTLRLMDYSGDVVSIFRQLGPNLKYLKMDDCISETDVVKLVRLLLENPQLAANLTYLYLDIPFNDPFVMLNFICVHWTKLETLYLSNLGNFDTTPVYKCISQLTKLTKFTVNSTFHLFTSQRASNLIPMKTMKVLEFGVTLPSTYPFDQFRNTFGRLFPNLEVIYLGSLSASFVAEFNEKAKEMFPNLKLDECKIKKLDRNKLQKMLENDLDNFGSICIKDYEFLHESESGQEFFHKYVESHLFD